MPKSPRTPAAPVGTTQRERRASSRKTTWHDELGELYGISDERIPASVVQQFAAKSRTTLSRDLAEVVADEVGIKTSAAELGRVARQAYLRDALTERVEDRMTLEDIKEYLEVWPKVQHLLVKASDGIIECTSAEHDVSSMHFTTTRYSRSCPPVCFDTVTVHGEKFTVLELAFADLLHSAPKLTEVLLSDWDGKFIDLADLADGSCDDIASGGIYVLLTPRGWVYVGVTTSFKRRMIEHALHPVNKLVESARHEDAPFDEWQHLRLVALDDDHPIGLGYIQEMLLNVLAGATEVARGMNRNVFDKADGAVLDALDVIILYEGARLLMQHRVKQFGEDTMVLPSVSQTQEWSDRFGSLVDVGVSGDSIRMILTHRARTKITRHLGKLPGTGTTRETGGRIGPTGVRATAAPQRVSSDTPLKLQIEARRERSTAASRYSRMAVQNDEEAMEHISEAFAIELD